MRIIIDNIKMPIRHTTEDVIKTARDIVRSDCISADNFEIYRQSLDARRKNNIHYVYSVSASTADDTVLAKGIRHAEVTESLKPKKVYLSSRPVVVGLGPCGLFAAWVLTLSGNPPLIIERGEDAESRRVTVKNFWKSGILNTNSNVQFGEGGAGAFSDGKLTTRISDPRQRFVLKTLVEFGAPKDILYKAKPHIGTDLLCGVITAMRRRMQELGAEVRFNTRLTDIKVSGGRVEGIVINDDEEILCKNLILAIGHSSRDTYERLLSLGAAAEPKPFAMGVRIEHSQEFIDNLQYGAKTDKTDLPPADYRVTYNEKDRSCYSFCMCPGGVVVNASSEKNRLAVNGMSYHSRSGANANSALVVPVRPTDFIGTDGGIRLQQKYEELAFLLGGGEGAAPIQLAEDFVKDCPTERLKRVEPTVTSGFKIAEIKKCLPKFVVETLRRGLCNFEHRMPGFSGGGAALTGIESRTSAPIRFIRGKNLESINIGGLYPSGEGAGYAGGIVSAAVDGIKSASMLIENNNNKIY